MALFLQFDIRHEFGLPFKTGSHFSLFVCPEHNYIPEEYPTQLPDEFWNNTDDPERSEFKHLQNEPNYASYRLILSLPTTEEIARPPDGYIEHQSLGFEKHTEIVRERHHTEQPPIFAKPEAGYPGLSAHDYDDYIGLELFKIGGHPFALQDMAQFTCCCNGPMEFLCQIPYPSRVFTISSNYLDTPWPNWPLFIDNMVYLFACRNQCHPYAVLVTVEN